MSELDDFMIYRAVDKRDKQIADQERQIKEREELIIDLLDGYSADDLFYGKGFSEEDAVKAIDLLQKCLENEKS